MGVTCGSNGKHGAGGSLHKSGLIRLDLRWFPAPLGGAGGGATRHGGGCLRTGDFNSLASCRCVAAIKLRRPRSTTTTESRRWLGWVGVISEFEWRWLSAIVVSYAQPSARAAALELSSGPGSPPRPHPLHGLQSPLDPFRPRDSAWLRIPTRLERPFRRHARSPHGIQRPLHIHEL